MKNKVGDRLIDTHGRDTVRVVYVIGDYVQVQSIFTDRKQWYGKTTLNKRFRKEK